MRILVVGAGPGGSIAGSILAEKGFDVTIVDRKVEPEKPVICGEFFTDIQTAKKFIPKGDILEKAYRFLKEEYIMRKHKGMEIEFDGVSKVTSFPVYIIDRHGFIGEIVNHAVGNGAKLLTKTTFLSGKYKEDRVIALLRDGNGVRSETFDYIIGADAYQSAVAKAFNLPHLIPDSDVALTITVRMKNVDYEKDLAYLLFSPDIAPRAYAWIFPSKGFYNVGVGLIKEDKRENMHFYLDRFLKNERFFKNAEIISGPLGKPLPVGGMNPKPGTRGVILVGDAAWLVVPTNGGGIHNALVSGILAAETLSSSSDLEEAHRDYIEKLRDYLGDLLDRSYKYRIGVERLYKHWRFFKLLARISPASWIINVILGKKSFAGSILKLIS
ncbi:MAG: geranylgeranyl reductase family protein [Candidatus Njordarchaeia archaeon]